MPENDHWTRRVDRGRRLPSLTIGDVAAFAGVTVRAVRHYHQRGLLPEPPRDESGYRRYDAQAVVDLIRIKALSQAGVPLARVRELLVADADEFAKALSEIDSDLQTQIQHLEEHRLAVAELASAESLALPAEVLDYLARLRAVGVSDRMVGLERDQWLLLAAHMPDAVRGWAKEKMTLLDDEQFVALYLAFDEAFEWQPGDPRLERLADAFIDLFAREGDGEAQLVNAGDVDEAVVALVDAQTVGASAGWRHLVTLLEARRTKGAAEGG